MLRRRLDHGHRILITLPGVGVGKKMPQTSLLLLSSVLVVPVAEVTIAQANTLQMSSDSSMTGWYMNEPPLSPANVTGGGFGEIFDTKLSGQVYAQPLVSQPTVLAVTQNDCAYGLNSTTGAIEWQDSFKDYLRTQNEQPERLSTRAE